MTTKKAILISAVSVALILLISFGITTVLAINRNSSQIDAEVASRIAEREVAYRQLIEEANLRIQALNAQVQGVSPASQAQGMLTADGVLSIAYQVVGNDQVLSGVPQLVNFQGTTAYEIPFINGMMYVDANSGAVLSNNVRTQINEQQAIQITADYLGVTNTSNFVVNRIAIDGTEAFKVYVNNYVLVVDKYGTITTFQVIKNASSNTGSSSSSSGDDDHEEEDDD
jgi:uncharacterized membrane protein YkoI